MFAPVRLFQFCLPCHKILSSLRNTASSYRYLSKCSNVVSRAVACHVVHLNATLRCRLQYGIVTSNVRHNSSDVKLEKFEEVPETNTEVVNVIFITHKGEEFPVKGKVGDNLLVLAQEAGLDVDGACCRQLKCTTCHMYIEDDYFDKAEEASEQELDLLDTAKFLKPNSRLTCQIHLTKELEGMRVRLPLGTVNFYVDGHKPSHH